MAKRTAKFEISMGFLVTWQTKCQYSTDNLLLLMLPVPEHTTWKRNGAINTAHRKTFSASTRMSIHLVFLERFVAAVTNEEDHGCFLLTCSWHACMYCTEWLAHMLTCSRGSSLCVVFPSQLNGEKRQFAMYSCGFSKPSCRWVDDKLGFIGLGVYWTRVWSEYLLVSLGLGTLSLRLNEKA